MATHCAMLDPQPSPAGGAQQMFVLDGRVLGRRRGLGVLRAGCKLRVQPHEHRRGTVIGPQSEDQPASMLDQPPGAVDEFLHHRLQAPALGLVAHRCVGPEQAALAHQAQDVHRQRRQAAYQRVGVELSRALRAFQWDPTLTGARSSLPQ